jgi:hypothetical protein
MNNSSITFESTKLVNPNELLVNDEKLTILGRSKNYSEIYDSIEKQGIITPLLVNKSNYVISGNLRLIIALELNMDSIPVNYVNIDESDMVTILNTDITREKTLKEKLIMYFILRDKYHITQGCRTDLDSDKKEQKTEFDKNQPLTVNDKRILKRLREIYTEDEILNAIDDVKLSGKKVSLFNVEKYLKDKKSKIQTDNGNKKSDESKDSEVLDTNTNKIFKKELGLTLEYNKSLDKATLKQEVNKLRINGGSLFITKVPRDRDWSLNRKMLGVGMMLYTFRQTSQTMYTYHFIFMKSNTPPSYQIEGKTVQMDHYKELRLTS